MELGGDPKRQRVRKQETQNGENTQEQDPKEQTGTPTGETQTNKKNKTGTENINRTVKHVCLDCKESDRKFNHPQKTYNYAEGGV